MSASASSDGDKGLPLPKLGATFFPVTDPEHAARVDEYRRNYQRYRAGFAQGSKGETKNVAPASSSTSRPPPFLVKLSAMLDDPDSHEFIDWTEDGRGIIVKRVDEFSDVVLPRFFKHRNFASFLRQLNMYNFYTTSQKRGEWRVFTNPHFVRGATDSHKLIRRKVLPGTDHGGKDAAFKAAAAAAADAAGKDTSRKSRRSRRRGRSGAHGSGSGEGDADGDADGDAEEDGEGEGEGEDEEDGEGDGEGEDDDEDEGEGKGDARSSAAGKRRRVDYGDGGANGDGASRAGHGAGAGAGAGVTGGSGATSGSIAGEGTRGKGGKGLSGRGKKGAATAVGDNVRVSTLVAALAQRHRVLSARLASAEESHAILQRMNQHLATALEQLATSQEEQMRTAASLAGVVQASGVISERDMDALSEPVVVTEHPIRLANHTTLQMPEATRATGTASVAAAAAVAAKAAAEAVTSSTSNRGSSGAGAGAGAGADGRGGGAGGGGGSVARPASIGRAAGVAAVGAAQHARAFRDRTGSGANTSVSSPRRRGRAGTSDSLTGLPMFRPGTLPGWALESPRNSTDAAAAGAGASAGVGAGAGAGAGQSAAAATERWYWPTGDGVPAEFNISTAVFSASDGDGEGDGEGDDSMDAHDVDEGMVDDLLQQLGGFPADA